MSGINRLPREVLAHIFSFLKFRTQKEFIYNIAGVCLYWEEICMDSSFWHSFDGTLPLSYLKKYCKNGYLRNTELLVFSPKKSIPSSKEFQLIFKNLPHVKCVNITHIIEHFKLKECSFFLELINHCPRLCEIIFFEKYTSTQPVLPAVIASSWTSFLTIHGTNLISLDFSNLHIPWLKDLFVSIASYCPNLESLIAQNLGGTNNFFPIPYMQNGLNKLKVLRLGDPIVMKNSSFVAATGFPNLDTFTHPSKADYALQDWHLKKLLMDSPDLKVLDIRGCALLTNDALNSLPTNSLERLYVSQTKLYEQSGFADILLKWGHSLVALDVSKMKSTAINNLFKTLVSCGSLQNLESLDLNNTVITPSTVKLIVQNCSKLNFLQLESCRSLGRGRKRTYRGQTEIKQLLNLDIEYEMEVN